ncbi:PQQ-binding-like beta-propeller repeat protein [Streptomyces sp. NPDC008313]|uniref:serine/threonine-protein kinase n=1 Tax=Streptomyces sp. NPDC008313 TaxID=3364826 RepID=UPI0036E0C8F3
MPPQRSAGTDPEAERPRYAGQYVLEAELGSGGMGIVHLARSASGLRLAVKVVHAELAQDPEFRGRFRQEVAAARRVSGAFTAPVVDADPEAARPWMATLFIPGPTLAQHVKRNGALPPARLRHLMAGLAEGLRDIHRVGVVHRDLKPSNVLLADDGPKVIDFGISRPSDSELRTETGRLIGTPPFMAPEQFRRPRQVGPAADVFALGSVIVHAATGSGPFDSDSPYLVAYQVVHDEPDLTGVPDELADLVARCLAKEPEDRPTPDEVMSALRSVSASYDTQAFVPAQRGPDASAARSATTHVSKRRDGGPHEQDGGRADGGDGAHESGQDGEGGKGGEGGEGGKGGKGGENSEDGVDGVDPSPGSPAGRTRGRRRWVPVATAVAVLALGAGAFASFGGSRGPAPERGSARSAAGVFRPWDVAPSAAGTKATGQPHCTYASRVLYCARPGLLAAAVDPADGDVLWARGDAGGRGTDVTAAPVLSGGLLQVVTRGGKRLTALEPGTGATRWSRDIGRYAGRVAHAGGVVLLTGADSEVTALDARTGEEKWHHAIDGQALPSFFSYGDGLAYAVAPAGEGTLVTAVDPETGGTRWQRRLAGTLSILGAHDGMVWFGSAAADTFTEAVVRYDVARREARRVPLRFPLPGAQAVVRGDTVYLLADGGALVAVDTGKAAQTWRAETSVAWASAPVAVGRRLYLASGDGRLLAVDAVHGELLGQTKARPGGGRGSLVNALPAPVAAGGKVYASAPDGTLFAVDARRPESW